ncbi:MAG TPA: serine/threonine-protein kinase, partial [Planctomycetota bacterium]|nr:serine/threonine-protein kinase [Planctomycetota bacterium]
MAERLGDYELLDELGRGGMGRVQRARHVPTGAVRAVKIMTGACDPEAVTRFRREAEALARLGGRGVVPIHETGLERGQLWFAMDLVPGGSLRARIKQGRLPWREAVSIAAELARVLARCHAAGIVHRDVKPDNVLLDAEGLPWLADFGCVKDPGASRLTETGTVLGTLAYMTPEQLEGRVADTSADVYALAALLHELIAGAAPFGSAHGLIAQRAARERPRPRLTSHGAPVALDEVLDRALERDPRRRTSAAALADELTEILADPAAGRRIARRALLGALAGGVLLVVFALLGATIVETRAEVADARGEVARARASLASLRDEASLGSWTPAGVKSLEAARERGDLAGKVARRASRIPLAGVAPLASDVAALLAETALLERAHRASEALRGGRVDAALEALEPRDHDPMTALVRARILLALGRAEAAAAEVAPLEGPAASPLVWDMLGDARLCSGDTKRAQEAYSRACVEPTLVRSLALAA